MRHSYRFRSHAIHFSRTMIRERRESFRLARMDWTKPDRTCFFEFERHKSANESASFIIFAYFCSKNCRYNRSGHFVCDYTGKRGSTQAVYHLTHTHTLKFASDRRRPAFIAGCRKRQWDAGLGSVAPCAVACLCTLDGRSRSLGGRK